MVRKFSKPVQQLIDFHDYLIGFANTKENIYKYTGSGKADELMSWDRIFNDTDIHKLYEDCYS